MSKPLQNRHTTPRPIIANRPGEGTELPVGVYAHSNVNGRTVTTMGADLSKAPVPDRKFTADTAFLIAHPYTLKLVFGQERLDGGLRSAIIVQMSRNGGVNFIRAVDAMSAPSVNEIAHAENIPIERPEPLSDEPDQALSLSANTPVAGISGHESCIDFYQASPFAVAIAARANQLAVEPVVRVTLRTSLLLGLIDALREALKLDLAAAAKLLEGTEHD